MPLFVHKQDRLCTCNIDARSLNHFCHGKVLSILRGFVTLVIQHAKRMRRIILSSGLSGSTILFHIIS